MRVSRRNVQSQIHLRFSKLETVRESRRELYADDTPFLAPLEYSPNSRHSEQYKCITVVSIPQIQQEGRTLILGGTKMSSHRRAKYPRYSVHLTNAGDVLFQMDLHPHRGGSGNGGEAEHRDRDSDCHDLWSVFSENYIQPRLEAAVFGRIHENLTV